MPNHRKRIFNTPPTIAIQAYNEFVLEPTLHTEGLGKLAGSVMRRGANGVNAVSNAGKAVAKKARDTKDAVKQAGSNVAKSIEKRIEKETSDYRAARNKESSKYAGFHDTKEMATLNSRVYSGPFNEFTVDVSPPSLGE